jgi:hypothetical protein
MAANAHADHLYPAARTMGAKPAARIKKRRNETIKQQNRLRSYKRGRFCKIYLQQFESARLRRLLLIFNA